MKKEKKSAPPKKMVSFIRPWGGREMLSVASREYFWKRVNIFMMKGGEAEGRGWGGGGK